MDDISDLEARTRAGSRTSLAVLADRWSGRLRAYIDLRLGPDLRRRVDADDVLQETLVSALRALPRTDLADHDVFGWFCQLADARLIDLARRHTAARRSVRRETGGASRLADWLAASLTGPSRAVVREEREARVRDALDGLPAATRELLRLRFADGLPTREIAARVGKSDEAVRAALSRALRQLEAAFGDSMRPD